MTEQPRITALMPVRNGMKFLERSKVILNASLSPGDELVVVNDNSTDGTSTFLKKWQEENPQVRVVENKKSGLISSLQIGVAESHNNWIARYDVDDDYKTCRLEMQRNAITTEVGAIFSDYKFITDSDQTLGILPSPVENHATSISLINGNRTPHPSVIFSKDIYFESGGYRESDYLVEDLSLWLRMSRISKLISVPEVLLNYKMHSHSVTLSNQQEMRQRKSAVIRNIGVNQIDIEYSIENANLILGSYESTDLRYERQTSFLYDIISLARSRSNGLKISPRNYKRITKFLLHPEIIRAVIKLKYEQKARQSYRGL